MIVPDLFGSLALAFLLATKAATQTLNCPAPPIVDVLFQPTAFGQPIPVRTTFFQNTVLSLATDVAITVTNAPVFVDTAVTAYSVVTGLVTTTISCGQSSPPPLSSTSTIILPILSTFSLLASPTTTPSMPLSTNILNSAPLINASPTSSFNTSAILMNRVQRIRGR